MTAPPTAASESTPAGAATQTPAATRRWRPGRAICILIVLAVAVERLHALWRAPATDFDDAYMFLRYANNWLAGYGLAWNRGEPAVYGATSLPHVLVVAFVRWLRPHAADAAVLQTSSRAAAVLLLVALALTCARFARHPRLRGDPWLWGALLVPLIAYGQPFWFHAESGMDTMLAALANTALVFSSLRLAERPTARASVATAAVAYGAYLVRPDNAIYAALAPTLALALVAPAPLAGARGRALLWFGATLGLLVGADLVIKTRLFGTPWPLGFYAKRPWFYGGFAGEFTWDPFLFLEVFLAGLWPFLAALLAFTGRRSARRVAALLIPVLVAFPIFFRINQIMGHLGRFYFPALPFIVIAAASSFDRWLGDHAPRARLTPSLLARLAASALLIVAGSAALRAAGKRYEARAGDQTLASLGGYEISATRPLPELDSWRSSEEIAALARAAPPGTRFAMSEHGLVGARAPDAVIIDVLGLHDRVFAKNGFTAAELWRRRPDALWMPHPDHTQMIRDILDSDEFWNHYVFYPDAFSYGIALRLDSRRYPALEAALRARWGADFPGFPQGAYVARRLPSGR